MVTDLGPPGGGIESNLGCSVNFSVNAGYVLQGRLPRAGTSAVSDPQTDMRIPVLSLLLLTFPVCGLIAADAPLRLEADAGAPGVPIPDRFVGLSFETADILARPDGTHLLSAENKPLVTLFHRLRLRSLRIGGNTADRPTVAMPTEADVDSVFAFAKAVDARVIYTLRLRGSDPSVAVPTARYIWAHYRDRLDQFAIGNEPNVYAKTFEEYLKILTAYKAAILAPEVAPGATFCGPSTTPNKAEWARDLAEQVGTQGGFSLLTQHEYVGGAGNKVTDPAAAREKLLSDSLHGSYEKIRDALAPAAKAAGMPWRIEETNSFYNGGAQHVSNTLASALWALDYLHWFALNGCEGVNFHTGDYVAAGERQTRCWYAAYWNTPAGVEVHPIAYAMLAFAAAQAKQGVELPVAGAPLPPQLSAYAVRNSNHEVVFTIINRSHAPVSVALDVRGPEAYRPVARFDLQAGKDGTASEEGVTLGGMTIGPDGQSSAKDLRTATWSNQLVVQGGSASVVAFGSDKSSM